MFITTFTRACHLPLYCDRADWSRRMFAIIQCRIFLSSTLLSKNFNIKIYATIILPIVLYECETWLLTLRVEHRLRVFENRVLRRIFVPKRDEVTGEWRELHNEELNDLYSSLSVVQVIKSRGMRWYGYVVHMGECSDVYRVLVGNPEGKNHL